MLRQKRIAAALPLIVFRFFEDNASNQNAVDPSVEHDPLLLSEVISMTGSSDADGSEALFVRLSDFTDTGATLVWLGSGPSPITVGTYLMGKLIMRYRRVRYLRLRFYQRNTAMRISHSWSKVL